ncbi:MAG: CbiX/SirB N-terminal domain-containing protein [Alphaproteobacteria bacterium]|nr:CbiX/SirB N-terminal domain-containing protein [Alphaproteobacteria bacterium]
MKTALILFAHGSRDPLWHGPIQAVQERIGVLAPELLVRCAYLELTEPDLPHCVHDLLAQGVQHIRILPMFLGMGRHAREDLPQLVQDLRAQHPLTTFEVLSALGEDPRLLEVTCQIALDKLN